MSISTLLLIVRGVAFSIDAFLTVLMCSILIVYDEEKEGQKLNVKAYLTGIIVFLINIISIIQWGSVLA